MAPLRVDVRVFEWVLQDQTVRVSVPYAPDVDDADAVRERIQAAARAAALEADNWRDRDSKGFDYDYVDPTTGQRVVTNGSDGV